MGSVYTNGTPLVSELKAANNVKMRLPIVVQGGYVISSEPGVHGAIKSVR